MGIVGALRFWRKASLVSIETLWKDGSFVVNCPGEISTVQFRIREIHAGNRHSSPHLVQTEARITEVRIPETRAV